MNLGRAFGVALVLTGTCSFAVFGRVSSAINGFTAIFIGLIMVMSEES